MDKHITYIFPSRSRKSKFMDAVMAIYKLSESSNYDIIGVLDDDDVTMVEFKDPDIFKMPWLSKLKVYFGLSKNKIHACNRELDKINSSSEIICLMSDDFVILQKGFDNVIREAFSDGFKGLVHLPDGRINHIPQKTHAISFLEYTRHNEWIMKTSGKWHKKYYYGETREITGGQQDQEYTSSELYDIYELILKKRLVTFPVMHIEYLRRFGYIYHPAYKSVCADDEQTQVAKELGLYKFVDKPIVEHHHYRHGFGEPDELYKHNDSGEMYAHDRQVFSERAEKNFDL